nr:hypothetical protein [uncultured Merdimonas sp.]
MTAQTNNTVNILEAANYQGEQDLNKENRKTLHKMMKYVRTFPLSDLEIETIRRDLLGMAMEAQKRGSTLQASLGEKPRDFCDTLIYSIGGIKSPGGRKLLHISGCYYQIIGALAIISNLFVLVISMINGSVDLLSKSRTDINPSDLLSCCACMILGAFLLTAGKRAYQYANNVEKSSLALRWGLAVLVYSFLDILLDIADFISTAQNPPLGFICIYCLIVLIQLIFPALYILGAHRNRPHPGTP